MGVSYCLLEHTFTPMEANFSRSSKNKRLTVLQKTVVYICPTIQYHFPTTGWEMAEAELFRTDRVYGVLSWRRFCEKSSKHRTGSENFPPGAFWAYSLGEQGVCAQEPPGGKTVRRLLRGAGNVTRTRDLLITKCSRSAQEDIFSPLGRFPLDMLFRSALFATLSPPHFFG